MSKNAFTVDTSGREHLEKWRPIPGFGDKYEASNFGRIRSGGTRILKQRYMHSGYVVVTLSDSGKYRDWFVHRMVLMAWEGEPPDGYHACHNNGVRDDNRIENLRWDTPSANAMDQVEHGTHHHVRKTHCPHGHPYDEENTVIHANGGRICRECRKIGLRKHYAENKEKYKLTPEQRERRNARRRELNALKKAS